MWRMVNGPRQYWKGSPYLRMWSTPQWRKVDFVNDSLKRTPWPSKGMKVGPLTP